MLSFMAAEAGLREALDLATCSVVVPHHARPTGPRSDGGGGEACVDRDNPRALRDSPLIFDVLVAAGGEDNLPISAAGPSSLWAAAEAVLHLRFSST